MGKKSRKSKDTDDGVTPVTIMGFLQAITNIALPTFAYFYYDKLFPFAGYNFHTDFLASAFKAFPLAILLIFFMQIVVASAGAFDKTAKQALADLLLPFLYLAIANIIYAKSIGWYLFEMGAAYGSSIILSFLVIVFFTVIIEKSYTDWDFEELGGYVLMAIPQLIFIIPGVAGVILFNKLIIQEIIGNNGLSLYTVANVIAYLASIIQITIYNYRWMRSEAAI